MKNSEFSIRLKNKSAILEKLISKKEIINKDDNSLIFYDIGFIESRINELKKLFPANTKHAIAVKAIPLVKILKILKKMEVCVETASLPEIHLALKAGFKAGQIFFDSPAKTIEELKFSLKKGININADSFDELGRINKLIQNKKIKSTIGIRINPQIGEGKISETSVAAKYSKFGIPLNEYRTEIIKYFAENQWLKGIHYHTGSQGMSIEMLTGSAKRIYHLLVDINKAREKAGGNKISFVDIGGGLSANYDPKEKIVLMNDYVNSLRKNVPGLFSSNIKLATEFGRYIYANSGWAVSKVEYVKKSKNTNTAIIHLGADMFLRESYMPGKWHHEIAALSAEGKIKINRNKLKYNLAGPLCFSGDFIRKGIVLPVIKPGDYILIHDTGAYTLSMWSRYNSRQIPKVIGIKSPGGKFAILKERESIENIIDFWS